MRMIKAAIFLSLDGVMQSPGAPEEDPSAGFKLGGWQVPYWGESLGKLMAEAMGDDYDLLLGRRSYEMMAAYWRFETETFDDFARKLNSVRKYVAARPDEPLDWAGSVRLDGDVVAAVSALKRGDGPPLLIQGSTTLFHALLAADLIDEITTLTCPVILGSGKRLFPADGRASAWTMVKSQQSAEGVVVTRYAREGELVLRSLTPDHPNPTELARRARLAREAP